ncbi:electron transfer flavoprotein subunit beta/FixA family protein [Pseudarthrobacter siccitolerans]
MKIVVLIKQVPDTYGERKLRADGRVDREVSDAVIDEISERAIELALQQKDADKSVEVVILSMGPESLTASVRKALSMGADKGVHVLDDALEGADAARTALVIAKAIERVGDVDLVVAGNASTDGRGGVVPAMVAEYLHLSHLASVDDLQIGSGVSGRQATESGTREVQAPLPAIVSITESADEARFPGFKGIMGAKRKPINVVSLADLGVDAGFPGLARTVVLSTAERPAREAGVKIHDEGDAAEKLIEFLAAERLI